MQSNDQQDLTAAAALPAVPDLQQTLARVVGAVHTSFADTDRADYGDLAPDAVVWPGAADEIVELLRAAKPAAASVAVSGAGTRARHRWPPPDGRLRIVLDTRRLTNILRLDETALLVQSQCGIQLRILEEALRREGLTLGPLPVSVLDSTLGGLLADPTPLAYSPLAGAVVDACVGVSVATPTGGLLETRISPRRATGPDVSRLYLGSGGALGVLTDAVLRVRRLPEHEQAVLFLFPDPTAALECAREALAHGIRPARLQVLGNEPATRALLGGAFALPAGLAVLLSAPAELVEVQLRSLEDLAQQRGGSELPRQDADRWRTTHPDPVSRQQRRAQAFLPHGRATAVLPQLLETATEGRLRLVLDQIGAQGCLVWIGQEEPAEGADEATNSDLQAILAALGLRPRRARHASALAERLRTQLDPTHILLSPRWH